MHKKYEVNWTMIKRGCQTYTKDTPQESKNDLTLEKRYFHSVYGFQGNGYDFNFYLSKYGWIGWNGFG